MRVYTKILLIISLMIASTIFATAYPSNFRLFDITYTELTKDARKQVDCLAENIYHEAGHESEEGKIAVALVTLNRTQDPRFPKDICGVVKQKTVGTCQFSWFCMPVTLNKRSVVYDKAMDVALHVYANYENLDDITKGALYYHADYVNPRWKLQRTTVIGRHIFYKEGGKYYDGKTKPVTKGRELETFILSFDGGSDSKHF
jgi:spore germination cell wall hydrolase CwlJ-like protein